MRPLTRSLALLAVAAVTFALPTQADASGGGDVAGGRVLSPAHPVLGFQGEFDTPTPLPTVGDPDPTVCVPQWCQAWSLAVNTTSPFLVSIRNANRSMDDGLNLYVDAPDGSQVGSSAGVGSDGQSVAVQDPQPGTYQLFVTVTYQYDPTAPYLGEARIMAPPTWEVPRCRQASPCPVLPQLRAAPPADVHIDGIPPAASTPLGFPFPVTIPTGNSCYLDETASTGAMRCLRFTSEVDNVGLGSLQIRVPWLTADGQSGFIPGECNATQVITWTDGDTTTQPAGPCQWHAQHAHFHYDAFVSFALYQVQADGSIGSAVVHSQKASFCLADDGYAGFGTAGPNGPRNYAGQPGCNVPAEIGTSGLWVEMGVSPGWGDIYTWDTPSQYIDITNVPAGTYDIVTETNPDGLLEMAGPAQQCSATTISLTATDVKVLGSAADVTCPPA